MFKKNLFKIARMSKVALMRSGKTATNYSVLLILLLFMFITFGCGNNKNKGEQFDVTISYKIPNGSMKNEYASVKIFHEEDEMGDESLFIEINNNKNASFTKERWMGKVKDSEEKILDKTYKNRQGKPLQGKVKELTIPVTRVCKDGINETISNVKAIATIAYVQPGAFPWTIMGISINVNDGSFILIQKSR